MHFVGVDGCRAGWVAVALTEAGEPSHLVAPSIADVALRYPTALALVRVLTLRTLPETPVRDRRNLRMEMVYAGPVGQMALTAAQALTRIRQICLALPEATEKEAWGAPTFRVRDRLFVMFVNDHHGDGRLAIWCNAGPGAQPAIVEADPRRFFVPPYVGKGGWIGIRLDRRPNWAIVAALVEEGYRTAAARSRAAKKPRGKATRPPRNKGHRGTQR